MCGIWAIFGSNDDYRQICNNACTIKHRGPDAFRMETIHLIPKCCLAFHRLAIIDDLAGMQPMRCHKYPHIWLLYNGEIYNHKMLIQQFGFVNDTECDGEVIIHLYHHSGMEFAAKQLDGVFAFILLNTSSKKIFLGRDTFGVKPLYYFGKDTEMLVVSSEAKGILGVTKGDIKDHCMIQQILPGHIDSYSLDNYGKPSFEKRTQYYKIGQTPVYKRKVNANVNDTKESIRSLFEVAVKKRLMSDRRIGCLLSGGLDSSLIASVLVKLSKIQKIKYPIQTFSIGIKGSTDIEAARKVSQYLGTEHHEIIFTPEEGLQVLKEVIYHLEIYDVITIRGSIGMYLLCKYIKENTDTTVIMSGEGSDELAQGYIYFHKAPCAKDADEDSRRLCNDLYLYDVLRCDKISAAWGLEIRVPFLDLAFSSYYLSLPAEDRIPHKGVEKYLVRSAFESSKLLPNEILWRPKEGFSDGISSPSRSWYNVLQEFTDSQITDSEFKHAKLHFSVNPPETKEALYYRRIFEEHYPKQSHFTPYQWMPKWTNAKDPSARTLKHYNQ